MSRTIHATARRENDGYIVSRDVRRAPRRQATTRDIVRAELARDMPAVRAALKGATR